MRAGHRLLSILLTTVLTAAACSGNSTTSPAATATTPVASPTSTETFTGTVAVGGASFYTFVVSVNGTVNVTLVSVAGAEVPSTVTLGLAIGTPSGTGCGTGPVSNVQAGAGPQITGTYTPGRYCVNVSDVGNLVAPATFVVTIAHP
jgi:ABC-type glycerol-3-phosphate transport system substrate-binding protein